VESKVVRSFALDQCTLLDPKKDFPAAAVWRAMLRLVYDNRAQKEIA